MSCPVCGQTPPRGANFCFACGTSLARSCPRCQAGQSPEARFCPECGTPLPAGPGDALDLPDEAAVAAAQPVPDEGREALDEPVQYARGRESRRRVAGLTGAFLLALIILGGAALWLRAGPRPAARLPVSAAPAVAPEPLAAPEPPTVIPPLGPPASIESATEQRLPPLQSEAAVPALPEGPDEAAGERPALPPRPPGFAESPSASLRAFRPGAAVSDVRIEIATERRPGGITDYSVRLRERDGTPVSGAAVSVRGRRADGVLVEASLEPAPEPGVYQAALRLAELSDARLRVARGDRVQDVRLPK